MGSASDVDRRSSSDTRAAGLTAFARALSWFTACGAPTSAIGMAHSAAEASGAASNDFALSCDPAGDRESADAIRATGVSPLARSIDLVSRGAPTRAIIATAPDINPTPSEIPSARRSLFAIGGGGSAQTTRKSSSGKTSGGAETTSSKSTPIRAKRRLWRQGRDFDRSEQAMLERHLDVNWDVVGRNAIAPRMIGGDRRVASRTVAHDQLLAMASSNRHTARRNGGFNAFADRTRWSARHRASRDRARAPQCGDESVGGAERPSDGTVSRVASRQGSTTVWPSPVHAGNELPILGSVRSENRTFR